MSITEITAAAPDPAIDEILGMTVSEREVLTAVLEAKGRLTVVIPHSISVENLLKQLRICCRAYARIDRARSKLHPVLGRLLLLVQANPKVYRAAGYETFADFRRWVQEEMGVGRTSCFDVMRMLRVAPDLSIEQYSRLESVKWNLLCQVAAPGGSDVRRLVDMAEGMSVAEFRNWCAEKRHLSKNASVPAVITISANLERKKRWQDWIADPQVQQWAGSADPGAILDALMSEASSEVWQGQ